jgi:hypothetical protein
MLGGRLDRRLADVIGVIGAGGSSRRTGKAFTGLLAARTKAKKPKRRGRR